MTHTVALRGLHKGGTDMPVNKRGIPDSRESSKLFDKCAWRSIILLVDKLVVHIAVPIFGIMYLVFRSYSAGEAADDAGLFERLLVD